MTAAMIELMMRRRRRARPRCAHRRRTPQEVDPPDDRPSPGSDVRQLPRPRFAGAGRLTALSGRFAAGGRWPLGGPVTRYRRPGSRPAPVPLPRWHRLCGRASARPDDPGATLTAVSAPARPAVTPANRAG